MKVVVINFFLLLKILILNICKNKLLKKVINLNVKILYFALVLSLFLGLYFDENSSGGAKHDYNFIKNYIHHH